MTGGQRLQGNAVTEEGAAVTVRCWRDWHVVGQASLPPYTSVHQTDNPRSVWVIENHYPIFL